MKKTVLIIALIAVAAAGGLALSLNGDDNQKGNTDSANTAPLNGKVATIDYTDDGFSPKSLSTTSPTAITINNRASKPLQFNSDPHPEHTDNDEFNVDTIGPGQNKTFIVTKKGTYSFHNHLNPSDGGTVTVE